VRWFRTIKICYPTFWITIHKIRRDQRNFLLLRCARGLTATSSLGIPLRPMLPTREINLKGYRWLAACTQLPTILFLGSSGYAGDAHDINPSPRKANFQIIFISKMRFYISWILVYPTKISINLNSQTHNPPPAYFTFYLCPSRLPSPPFPRFLCSTSLNNSLNTRASTRDPGCRSRTLLGDISGGDLNAAGEVAAAEGGVGDLYDGAVAVVLCGKSVSSVSMGW